MSITAPENNLPLPEALQQRIDAGQNNVTLLEIETTRLQKLVVAENDKLTAINTEKKSIEAQIKSLKDTLNVTIEDAVKRKLELTSLENLIENAKKTLSDTVDKNNTITQDQHQKSTNLDAREVTVKKVEDDINTRQIALLQSESIHAAKVAKLKQALE